MTFLNCHKKKVTGFAWVARPCRLRGAAVYAMHPAIPAAGIYPLSFFRMNYFKASEGGFIAISFEGYQSAHDSRLRG